MSEDENDPDFRDLMVETLNQNGVLAKIRAELRAQIYLTLDDDLEERRNQTKTLFERTEETEALYLIYDFLNFYNLDFTLSVFEAETDYNEVSSNRNQNLFFHNINVNNQLTTTPVLVKILKQFKKLSSTNNVLNESEQLFNLNSTYDLKSNLNTTYNSSVANKSNFENSLYLHYGNSSVEEHSNFDRNNVHDQSNKTSPWSESSVQFQDSLNVSEATQNRSNDNTRGAEAVSNNNSSNYVINQDEENSKIHEHEETTADSKKERCTEISLKQPSANVSNLNDNNSSSDISECLQIDSDEISNSAKQTSRSEKQINSNGQDYRMMYKDTEMCTNFGENYSDDINSVSEISNEKEQISKKESLNSNSLLIDLNKTCSSVNYSPTSIADTNTSVAHCILDETLIEPKGNNTVDNSIYSKSSVAMEKLVGVTEIKENGYSSDSTFDSRSDNNDFLVNKASTEMITNGKLEYPLNLDTELEMLAQKINIDNFDSENSDYDLSPSINNSLKEIENNIDTLKLKCEISKINIETQGITNNENANNENKIESPHINVLKLDKGKSTSRSISEMSEDSLQIKDFNKLNSHKNDKVYKTLTMEHMCEEKSPKSDKSSKLTKINSVNDKIAKLSSLSDLPPILTKPKTSTTLPSFYLDKKSADRFDLDLDSLDNYKEDDIFSISGSEIQETSLLSTNNDISPKSGDLEDNCNETPFPYFNKERTNLNTHSDYTTSRGLFTMTSISSAKQGEEKYGIGDGVDKMNRKNDENK